MIPPIPWLGRLTATTVPITTQRDAHTLLPLGPWEECMLANLASPQDSDLVAAGRTLRMMVTSYHDPVDTWLGFTSGHYFNAAISITRFLPEEDDHHMPPRHRGGHGSKVEVYNYTCWLGVHSYPLLMTRDTLPRTLQTALSDTIGATRGRTFEP
jgi:hypothetical protein